MGRDLDPKCKKCRREGKKLFLKGERCYSPKCPMIKRKYPPGIHGAKGYPRLSGYGIQLREKQRTKRMYGILERQFRNYFKKAENRPGDTGTNLLTLLESRLDNVIYRAGIAASRNTARQIIGHGHVEVNEKRVNIPSYQVKSGDTIQIKKTSHMFSRLQQESETRTTKGEIPDWLSLDSKALSIKVTVEPDIKDLAKEINTRLIVEFYSR